MKKILLTVAVFAMLAFVISTIAMAEDLTAQSCKDKAIAAGKLLEAEGEAAIAKLKDAAGEFSWAGGEGYIWVHNLDGMMVMHPKKPAMDGTALLEIRDVNGVYLFAAMNEIAGEKGAGWVAYAWPKPGAETPSPKVSYVVKAGNYVAGAGIYDVTKDDIKKQFPEDPIYEE